MAILRWRPLLLTAAVASTTLLAVARPHPSPRRGFKSKIIKAGIHVDTNRVRVDGVYLHVHTGSDPAQSWYNFLRFFSNGRVYRSAVYHRPFRKEDLNNVEGGHYEYYRVDSNRITIEGFALQSGYFYEYSKIAGSTIEKVATKARGWSFPAQREEPAPSFTYEFYPVRLEPVANFW